MAEAILTSQNYSSPALINLIYPIGSIYFSVNSTSPQQLFGGEWEQIKDKFLLSAGDTYSGGSEGGEAAHTLTVDEMPSHTHNLSASSVTPGDNVAGGVMISSHDLYPYGIDRGVHSKGGSQPHNNMPPYIAVYVWKRTA